MGPLGGGSWFNRTLPLIIQVFYVFPYQGLPLPPPEPDDPEGVDDLLAAVTLLLLLTFPLLDDT